MNLKQEQKGENNSDISVIMVVYNEEKIIETCLKSVKDIATEILVMHDGPCKDKTLEICKKYTNKIIVNRKNMGLPGPILPGLLKKAKGPWILKIDADEFLSPELQKNIKQLAMDPNVDAYLFKWLYRNKGKNITKNWPKKMALYRKSKASLLGFPHRDDPILKGNIVTTPYLLEHRPPREGMPTWKEYKEKVIKRYARVQAEWTLKNFDELQKFQWKEKDFSGAIKLRRRFPLLSAIPMAILAFFRILFTDNAWREGWPALRQALTVLLYYPYVGYLIYQLKKGKSF